jgi:hypothetical protein
MVEEIKEVDCLLLAEENDELALRRSDFQSGMVRRLTFWKCKANSIPKPDDLIGYTIVKDDKFNAFPGETSHVYECVMPPVRTKKYNNFVHCFRQYHVRSDYADHQVEGVLYAQQNAMTFVCAHVALRTVLSCLLPQQDITYKEINSVLGIDHQTRRLGDGGTPGMTGLTSNELESVFTHFGFSFEKDVNEPKSNPPVVSDGDYASQLYFNIQSGFPAFLAFELDLPQGIPPSRHVIPVFGYTLNEDTWVPEAERHYFTKRLSHFPAESWLSTFVVHDDNFGPYYCLPRHFLSNKEFRYFLGVWPKEVVLNAKKAELLGLSYLTRIADLLPLDGGDWFNRFKVFAGNRSLIIRVTYISKDEYLQHVHRLTGRDGSSLEQSVLEKIEACLPQSFWIAEASAQELFSASRRKFGEVLLFSDKDYNPNHPWSMMILCRLPGTIFYSPPTSVSPGEFVGITGHTSLIRE